MPEMVSHCGLLLLGIALLYEYSEKVCLKWFYFVGIGSIEGDLIDVVITAVYPVRSANCNVVCYAEFIIGINGKNEGYI